MSQGNPATTFSLSNTILTIVKSQNQKVLTGDINCPQLPTAKQPGHAWVRIGLNPAQRFEGTVVSEASGTYFAMAYSPSSEPFAGAVEVPMDAVSVWLDMDAEPYAESEDVIVIEA